MRRLALLMLLIVATVVLTSCGNGGGGQKELTPSTLSPVAVNGTVMVIIDDFAFNPPALTIDKGIKVTWTNKYPLPHRVTADGGEFASGALGTGATFSYVFDASGTYAYHCDNHPSMKATVTVK